MRKIIMGSNLDQQILEKASGMVKILDSRGIEGLLFYSVMPVD
jgi:hypothetical protein